MSDHNPVPKGMAEFWQQVTATYDSLRPIVEEVAPEVNLPVLDAKGVNLTEAVRAMQYALVPLAYIERSRAFQTAMCVAVADWLTVVNSARRYDATHDKGHRMLASEAVRQLSESLRDVEKMR